MNDHSITKSRGRLVGPGFRLTWIKGQYLHEQALMAQGEADVDRVRLHAMVNDAFAGRMEPNALRPPEQLDDQFYYLPTLAEAVQVFNSRSMAERNAWAEIMDCEDFAYWLRSDFAFNRYCNSDANTLTPFAAGIIWGRLGATRHALNVVATADEGMQLMDSMPGGVAVVAATDWPGTIDYIVI